MIILYSRISTEIIQKVKSPNVFYCVIILLQVIDHTQRLGCTETGGYAVLKAHQFFASTEWDSLHLQKPPELHPFLPANSEDSENLWSQYMVPFYWLAKYDTKVILL